MKFEATIKVSDDDFGGGFRREVVEFDDVKEYAIMDEWFYVRKNNGDEHAIRTYSVEKFSLTKE